VTDAIQSQAGPSRSARILISVLVALAYNCGFGLTYGSYGVVLSAYQSEFGISRAEASLGLTAFVFGLCVASPLAGLVLQRVPIRLCLVLSAGIAAAGYMAMAYATSFEQIIALFAIVGCCACFLSIVGPVTLIGQWFDTGRGKALAITTLPMLQLLTPLVAAQLMPAYGYKTVLMSVGGVLALVALLLVFVRDRPAVASDAPVAANAAPSLTGAAESNDERDFTTAEILRSSSFWFVSLGVGMIAGGGVMFSVHAIPFAVGREIPLHQAAIFLSMFGGAGMIGILIFGWLADRLQATTAFAMCALFQVLIWVAMIMTSRFELLLVISALIGACMMSVPALHGAALTELFGRRSVSRAMGFSYFIKLPFMLGAAPMAGYLFDRTGNYVAAFASQTTLLLIAGLLFAYLAFFYLRPRPA